MPDSSGPASDIPLQSTLPSWRAALVLMAMAALASAVEG